MGRVSVSAWEFTIPLTVKPPTANSRLHWAARARVTAVLRAETHLIAVSERNRLGAPLATDRRRLELTYIRPKGREGSHPLDADSVAAAMKPIVDAIVRAGWLRDDSAPWCEYVLPLQAVGKRRAVVVRVVELAADRDEAMRVLR